MLKNNAALMRSLHAILPLLQASYWIHMNECTWKLETQYMLDLTFTLCQLYGHISPTLGLNGVFLYHQHAEWVLIPGTGSICGEQLAVQWLPPFHQSCSPPLNRINRSRTAPEQMYPVLPDQVVTVTRENVLQQYSTGIQGTM